MPFDASDRKQVRRAEKAAAVIDRQRVEVVASLMSTIAGRAYVHDKLVSAHVFQTSFAPDALAMAFAEGERNQGLQLLNDVMTASPDAYILMTREASERYTSSERARGQDNDGRDQGREPGDDPSGTSSASDPYDYDDDRPRH